MSPGRRVAAFLVAVFAASGVTIAFQPLWLAARGLSPAEIGAVLGTTSILRLAATPAWGVLSDRLGRRPPVLFIASALSFASAILLIPLWGFWPILVVSLLHGVANAPLMPVADALSLGLAREGRLVYGPVRSAGSAAFAAANAAAGWVIGAFGAATVPVMLAVSFAGAAVSARFLPDASIPPRAPRISGGLRLMRHRPFLLTLAASAAIQGAHAAYYGLASIHWRANGLSDAAIGLLWAEGVAAESAFFLWGRRFADRIGPGGLTAVAAAASVVRWTVLSQTTSLGPLIAVQWLHGATFGMQHLSSMIMLTRTIPPERAATAQTVLAALGSGAPTGLLLWVVGALYTGSGSVFLYMAALGGCGLILAPFIARAFRSAQPA